MICKDGVCDKSSPTSIILIIVLVAVGIAVALGAFFVVRHFRQKKLKGALHLYEKID